MEFIIGVPFSPLFHHDGRFFRRAGLFAFTRREGRGCTVLHLELTPSLSTFAGPSHPRWGWALTEGLNELLIHQLGLPAAAADLDETTVTFHADAQICLDPRPSPNFREPRLDDVRQLLRHN